MITPPEKPIDPPEFGYSYGCVIRLVTSGEIEWRRVSGCGVFRSGAASPEAGESQEAGGGMARSLEVEESGVNNAAYHES